MMQIKNSIGLIGDAVNTYGIMRDLSQANGGLEVAIHPEAKWFFDLLPPELNIKVVDWVGNDAKELDLVGAFNFSHTSDLHMSQCYHYQFGLATPTAPIRPVLNVPDLDVPVYDYLLSPFSRSLPIEQKWDMPNWEQLANRLKEQGYEVAVLGNSQYDQKFKNITNEQDRPIAEVLNMIKKCRKGLISVVTGTSHLAYAMGTKNYLLNNQGGKWGVNPDAVSIETYIPNISVDEVITLIIQN